MRNVQALPAVETWLESEADSWSGLRVEDYKNLVRLWSVRFLPQVASNAKCLKGSRAIHLLESRLPADVFIISGLPVPQLASAGGLGPAAFFVRGLRKVHRDLANQMELIAIAEDFTWSCVFSHEAGAFVHEQLYEIEPIIPFDWRGGAAEPLQ